MKHYAVFLSMLDAEKSIQYRTQHLKYLDDMRNADKVLANGRFLDGSGGMVIYRANSIEEASTFARNDPYVIHKARDFVIHEWEMVLNEQLININA